MKIKEVMQPSPIVERPSITLKEAAEIMANKHVGFLLFGDDDRLQGTLTDRDIVIRGVSAGMDINNTTVEEILTDEILYCRENQNTDEVAQNMSEQQVRRLPVVDEDKRLVGIISLGDIAQHLSADIAGRVLKGVTEERHAA